MTYNPLNQYRCTIIRGKAKSQVDDLLATYSSILDQITPISNDSFKENFNRELSKFLPTASEKTLDNHRTEIVTKLFGMVSLDSEGTFYLSERTKKYLSDGDQPAFFKDLCFKFQFPNGMDKLQTLTDRMQHQIKIRPYCLVIEVLSEASKMSTPLSKDEIAFFVLNNEDALSGKSGTNEILQAIIQARKDKNHFKVEEDGKASSYSMQHITEQLNYLELANLIVTDNGIVKLNRSEANTIEVFSRNSRKLLFDVYSYNIGDPEQRNNLYFEWQEHYAKLSLPAKDGLFDTTVESLTAEVKETEDFAQVPQPRRALDTVQLGDEGEKLVYNYEVERVSLYDRRLTNKIHLLGKTKGLGYDIQSIFGNENIDNPEFVKYIEVKSTKRVTLPDLSNEDWFDTLNLTRNEWVAASQHQGAFEIYRVYFTKAGILVLIIKNPVLKNDSGLIKVVPTQYRMDFNVDAIDSQLNMNTEEINA